MWCNIGDEGGLVKMDSSSPVDHKHGLLNVVGSGTDRSLSRLSGFDGGNSLDAVQTSLLARPSSIMSTANSPSYSVQRLLREDVKPTISPALLNVIDLVTAAENGIDYAM